MKIDAEVVLVYTLGFFVYINIKVALFIAFYKYAKRLITKKKNAKKIKTPQISDAQLRVWYEKSTFKKISKLEYTDDIGAMMKKIFKSGDVELPPDTMLLDDNTGSEASKKEEAPPKIRKKEPRKIKKDILYRS